MAAEGRAKEACFYSICSSVAGVLALLFLKPVIACFAPEVRPAGNSPAGVPPYPHPVEEACDTGSVGVSRPSVELCCEYCHTLEHNRLSSPDETTG